MEQNELLFFAKLEIQSNVNNNKINYSDEHGK